MRPEHCSPRELDQFRSAPGLAVIALPRGGVPVAWEVARKLNAPFDVLVVHKLALPHDPPQPPFGAVARGGVRVLDTHMIAAEAIPTPLVERIAATEETELARREHVYRGWARRSIFVVARFCSSTTASRPASR